MSTGDAGMTLQGMRRAAAGCVLLLLLALPAAALADGCFLPERVRMAPVPIPSQRALIVHPAGIERLTVESTMDAGGQSFGWIVPVPARPTAVERATAGPLDALDEGTEPIIAHETGFGRDAGPWLLWFLVFLACARAALLHLGFREKGLVATGMLALLLLLVPTFLVPGLLGAVGVASRGGGGGGGVTARVEGIPGIRAAPVERVGSYDVTVLEADDAAALDRWLDASGLAPVPAAGRPVVEAHVREGWFFVVVRLAGGADGRHAPHPLRIVFPAAEAVYPMRLTALSGGPTAVRLHVIADAPVEGRGLRSTFRDFFPRVTSHPGRSASPVDDVGWTSGEGTRRSFTHPHLVGQFWSGCFLTRLEGEFRPADMDEDIRLAPGGGGAMVAKYWSREGARETAARWSLLVFVLASLVLLFIPPGNLPLRGRRNVPFLHCLLVLAVFAGALFLAVRAALPTVAVERVGESGRRWRESMDWVIMTSGGTEDFALAGLTAVEAAERVRDLAARRGVETRVGDREGEFEVLELEQGVLLRVYKDREGNLREILFPSSPSGPAPAR